MLPARSSSSICLILLFLVSSRLASVIQCNHSSGKGPVLIAQASLLQAIHPGNSSTAVAGISSFFLVS
jgi:hypothetical protein